MKMSPTRWSLIFGGIVLVYVLSVGPAYRMAMYRAIPNSWFVTMYEPVIYVGESVPIVHGAFDWYMRLWYDHTCLVDSR